MDSLGGRIRLCRTLTTVEGQPETSQGGFAFLVGEGLGREPVSAATISRWESGESIPDLSTLLQISRLAGVDPGWLAFGQASRAPAPQMNASRRSVLEALQEIEVEKQKKSLRLLKAVNDLSRSRRGGR